MFINVVIVFIVTHLENKKYNFDTKDLVYLLLEYLSEENT